MADDAPGGNWRERLRSVLDAASPAEIEAVLDRLWQAAPFAVVRPPRPALLLVAARDPFATPFYLGELLVTEAEVALGDFTAGGAVCGDEPERALLLAAAGAAEQAGAGKAIRVLEEFRRHLEPLRRRQQEENEALVAATRVAFGSLRPERVDFGSLGGA
ncbi:MAG: phosphonate C-P lyase system protein PhnG [Desulfobacterales bacterium]